MIKIGIYGYGNLGRGVECAIKQNVDMTLVAVFTRRNPESIKLLHNDVRAYHVNDVLNFVDKIDVMVLCGGSATDLPIQTPELAANFNVIDSFDNHSQINVHFDNVNKVSLKNNKISMIAVGWDPGMFSINRLYNNAILPNGNDYTFWGKGVSQGHSDAIRRIDGVIDARQYTIPKTDAIKSVRSGISPKLSIRDKHSRECFVVVSPNADKELIEKTIKTMPAYFSDYDTIVHFISMDELNKNHSGLPHGGFVIRAGKTGWNDESNTVVEYSLKLDSNPEFTANVLIAYSRAIYELYQEKQYGCKTVFDIAPKYLLASKDEEIRKLYL